MPLSRSPSPCDHQTRWKHGCHYPTPFGNKGTSKRIFKVPASVRTGWSGRILPSNTVPHPFAQWFRRHFSCKPGGEEGCGCRDRCHTRVRDPTPKLFSSSAPFSHPKRSAPLPGVNAAFAGSEQTQSLTRADIEATHRPLYSPSLLIETTFIRPPPSIKLVCLARNLLRHLHASITRPSTCRPTLNTPSLGLADAPYYIW